MLSILRTLFLAVVLVAPQSHAALVATDAALAEGERSRVKALIERPEVAKQLEQLGIPPGQAAARVDAMTEAAGGDMANQTLLLLIILIIVLILVL
jgi:hypothetical protein